MADDEKKNVPEEYDGHLDCGNMAVCCEFNRIGTLLAVGYNDGRLAIWDLKTTQIARAILSHANHPISSISWSRNGHKVVTCSVDHGIAIWHVLSGECKVRWVFNSPLLKVQFNPRNENLILVCPFRHVPILLQVDYTTGNVVHTNVLNLEEETNSNFTASFDRRGQYIYTGDGKGQLTILRCSAEIQADHSSGFDVVSSFKIPNNSAAAIKEIEFARRDKRYFLVNSADRAVRLFDCDSAIKAGIDGSCDEIRKFQDMVHKMSVKRCCFSPETNVNYVCGGLTRQHTIYIWDIETGAVKKMLSGVSKGDILLDLQWHPTRPIVASVTSGGLVVIFARAECENWSAYAPTFEELDENKEYDERESEFDLEDADAVEHQPKKRIVEDEEDVEIDVKNVTLGEGDYKSSDEDEYDADALEFIPITLDEYELADAAAAATH